jgi:uncharacterized protein (TIGR02271 family)
MSRTVTAMFDSRSEAEAARSRLTSSNIDADRVRIIDKSSSPTSGSYGSSSGSTGGEGQGFWASLKDMFVPDEDRHAYGEGISRGGFLLCAEVDENEVDEACRLLEESDSVDFEQREQSWRSEGWNGQYGGASTGGFAGGSAAMTDSMTGSNPGSQTFGSEPAGGTGQSFGTNNQATTGQSFGATDRTSTIAEEHIPIVEEELRIGKREVNRGGARVRSYVREVPVHEQVTLREEHVSVERRPVGETLRAGDLNAGDAFQERNIEMTETAEEAVVAKEARIKEELVVRKTAEEHVENIDDTVRRTEVDIDEGVSGSGDRSAFGGFGSGSGGTTGGTPGATGTTGSTDRTDSDLESTNLQDRTRGF